MYEQVREETNERSLIARTQIVVRVRHLVTVTCIDQSCHLPYCRCTHNVIPESTALVYGLICYNCTAVGCY